MITKDQAIELHPNGKWPMPAGYVHTEFHYGECRKINGPRGGVKIFQETWHRNGQTQTWKRRPDDFRIPVKYGLRAFGYVSHFNCSEWHVASECPLNKP